MVRFSMLRILAAMPVLVCLGMLYLPQIIAAELPASKNNEVDTSDKQLVLKDSATVLTAPTQGQPNLSAITESIKAESLSVTPKQATSVSQPIDTSPKQAVQDAFSISTEQTNNLESENFLVTPNMEQVTSVSQLTDVKPSDWSFEALRTLVERYGCIAGYPDGTFKGNRAITRYEFAAGLNACMDQIAR
jgi:hypothetical protein